MPSSPTDLPAQHQRFADEYLIDFNATAAYRRAGYKATGNAAFTGASRLLAKPAVQAYLAKRREELSVKTNVDLAAVLQRLAFMALGDIRTLYRADGTLKGIHELTAEEASLIQGIEFDEIFAAAVKGKEGKDDEPRIAAGITTKIKLVNRLDAAKTLGQHFGAFAKKVEHSGPGGGPIQQQHSAVGELLELIDGADTGPGAAASRR